MSQQQQQQHQQVLAAHQMGLPMDRFNSQRSSGSAGSGSAGGTVRVPGASAARPAIPGLDNNAAPGPSNHGQYDPSVHNVGGSGITVNARDYGALPPVSPQAAAKTRSYEQQASIDAAAYAANGAYGTPQRSRYEETPGARREEFSTPPTHPRPQVDSAVEAERRRMEEMRLRHHAKDSSTDSEGSMEPRTAAALAGRQQQQQRQHAPSRQAQEEAPPSALHGVFLPVLEQVSCIACAP